MTKAPIFIGGMYKSGTTLLRAMLSQHSNIASGLETFWFDLGRGDDSPEALRAACDRLARFFGLDADEVRAFHAEATTPEAFLDRLMRTVAAREGKPRWAEKTPLNIAYVDRIWATWPQAHVLHIIRDPRDVYASLVEAKKWEEPEVFAHHWTATIGRGLELIAALNPSSERYHELRYEDLILSPEPVMRKVLDFLSEPWEPAVAYFAGQSEDFNKVLEATGKASTTLERLKKPLTNERVGLWRRVLNEPQLAAVREAVARAGYGKTYDRVVTATPGN